MRRAGAAVLAAVLALTLAGCDSTAYSDSINDLPLLQAVNHAVVVDPDPTLAPLAAQAGWPLLHIH